MKKLLVTLIALGFSSVAMAGISTSGAPHNFNDGQCTDYTTTANDAVACAGAEDWNTSGEVCKVCHAPHEKISGLFAEAQLWNHTLSTQNYTMYNEAAASGPFGTIDGAQQTNASSTTRLCLSCHDGTTAIDSFGGHAGSGVQIDTATAGYNAIVNKGLDLTTSHPVSMEYYTGGVVVDTDLHALTNTVSGSVQVQDLLEEETSGTYTVECSSCHEPHQDRTGNNYLLVVANTNSTLCLGCHNK